MPAFALTTLKLKEGMCLRHIGHHEAMAGLKLPPPPFTTTELNLKSHFTMTATAHLSENTFGPNLCVREDISTKRRA